MAAIDTFYPIEFQTSFEHVLQQEDSMLGPTITRDNFTGDRKHYNILEDVSASPITTRKAPTPDGEIDAYKVWSSQRPYHIVTTFDEWDQHFLGSIVLPTSDAVRSHVMAYNRQIDQVIISALGGNRVTGADGSTSTALPSGRKVAKDYVESGSTADSGLTIAKLRRSKFLLDSAKVPKADRFLACTSQQIQDLLRTTEVTSADYNVVRALSSGDIDTFLGFKFVVTEELTTIAASTRGCYAYHRRAIKMSAVDRTTKMDERSDLNHALQIRTKWLNGAMRYMDEMVVQIACSE
jgi:hypothetical protein